MRIVFGMHLDGVIWSNKEASIGEVMTGPMGLLRILETRLGIGMRSVHPVYRIDEYMKRLQLIDRESIWLHESFAIDPWSTARQLLEWRDELVEAGWYGQAIPSGSLRLDALAELECVDVPLSGGRSDQLRRVTACLKCGIPVHIESIILTEPSSMLPLAWRHVFELLQSQGTNITCLSMPDRKPQGDNLSLIQAVIGGTDVHGTLSLDDDTLILLKVDNEWEAAEHLALWLASKNEANDQVAIICGMDTSVLDYALKRHGLPCLGRTAPSRWREIQQILPLTLANAWRPVDIRLVVELLLLTVSVFPKWVCKIVLKAVTEEPGIGGRAWNHALSKISEKYKDFLTEKDDPESEEKAETLIRSIQSLLVNDRFDSVEGIPEAKLRERCQVLIERLSRQARDMPILAEVINQAREMQKLSLGKGFIPRIMLERMLDTIIGPGNTLDDIGEEVAPWYVVDHPGQITNVRDEIIWWGFNAPATSSPDYWSYQERKALEKCGIFLEETRNFRSREAYDWQKGIMHADKRFIAIYISQIDGEEVERHPYWDTIWSAASRISDEHSDDDVKRYIYSECSSFGHTRDWQFAGRKSTLQSVQKAEISPVTDCYTVPNSVIKAAERLSYTQMSTLIGCPFKWTLEYHAGLQPVESQSVPTGNQMIGTFCHRIIEELYSETNHLDADNAYEKTGYLFDSLITSMASELLLEGNAAERQRYKTFITEAVRHIVKDINQMQLTVEKTEALLEGTVDGIPYKGFSDMLLRDSRGHPFVLDMKWSSSLKYKKKEIEEGTSLQLAAYDWMLRSAEPSHEVHAGYFMLAQGQLLSSSLKLGDEAIKTTYKLEDIWNTGVASLKNVLKSLESGTVEVRGIIEKAKAQELELSEEKTIEELKKECRKNGLLYQSPPCMFCDFDRLCGI